MRESEASGATTSQDLVVAVASRAHSRLLLGGIALLFLLASVPFGAGTEWAYRMTDFFILLALAECWNFMLGYGGVVTLGLQAFIGIGAYSLWFFSDILHVNPFICVILATATGTVASLPIAAIVFRLKGGYLAIGTWVVADALRLTFSNIRSAGGAGGVGIRSVAGLDTVFRVAGAYWWALALALAATGGLYLILRSRGGLAFLSMRDDELAAESSGVDTWRMRLLTFMVGGAGSAAAGAITALSLLRIQPAASFSVQWMAYIIFIVVIGGVGFIEGPVVGTIVYFFLRETLAHYAEWYFIVLGLLAIVVAVWSPEGIYGYVQRKTGFTLFPLQRKALPHTHGRDAGSGQ